MNTRFLSAFVFCILWSSCCTIRITCPNGDIIVPQSVEKTFPAYLATYEGTLKGSYAMLDRLNASAEADVRAKVAKLREDLNQQSNQLEMICKLAMVGLQTMPCDATARESYWRALALVNERTRDLNRINSELRDRAATTAGSALTEATAVVAKGTSDIQASARATNPASLQAAVQDAEAAARRAADAASRAEAAGQKAEAMFPRHMRK